MITPSQITIDTSGLPAVAQNAIASIDAALQSWAIGDTEKYWSIQWANVGGWTQAKQDGLTRLIEAYEMLGWHTRVMVATQVMFKAAFQR